MSLQPNRGEVWWADFSPAEGHEQSGRRPAVIISADTFNHGPAGLVVVLPMTTTNRGISLHVRLEPPEASLDRPSVILCDQIRTISKKRLDAPIGHLNPRTLEEISTRLQTLLRLP